MAVIAVWSMSGQAIALLVDAIVSIGIGVLFGITGLMMLLDQGGAQAFLNVIFGVLFVSAGVRNGREYSSFAACGAERSPTSHAADRAPLPSTEAESEPPSSSLASQLRERARSTPHPADRSARSDNDVAATALPPPPPQNLVAQKPASSNGFLASFANEEPPPSGPSRPCLPKCHRCNRDLSRCGRYCPTCGAKQAPLQSASAEHSTRPPCLPKCHRCNRDFPSCARYCPTCGAEQAPSSSNAPLGQRSTRSGETRPP